MVARVWTGTTSGADADAYVAHLRERTFPQLRAIEGHAGAYVLKRTSGPLVEFVVVTLWSSRDAIARFAGEDAEAAVVPPEAQALLSRYDERAVHWDVPLAVTLDSARPSSA